MQKYLITKNGYISLRRELRHLKVHEREQIIKDIVKARNYGDLSENAEYHAAKEKQNILENRISSLEKIIFNLEVIETSKVKSKVVLFGATVKLIDEEGNIVIYKIVSDYEANASKGLISINSPLSKSIINKEVFYCFNFPTKNNNNRFFEILSIQYI